ncbi:hypothetical protein [Cohnella fermenti]|uniref:Uncharacterized protein n=1 Tax=Cohnella fermenti TaxID=2565925 RepID=A0A4S4C8S5_9BACL|nr:hypothetical protein [Cohnella fermenti]THF83765.1 hypothetical protein E6C55_03510 [Cohnella fermenti]
MITIRKAAFRRILDRGGQRFAEVELETDQSSAPQLLAYFRREGSGRYQLVRIILNDSAAEEDEARAESSRRSEPELLDLTSVLFAGPNHGALEDRAEFGWRILEYGDIRSQLDRQLL